LPDEEGSRDEHATEEETFAENLTERCPETGTDCGAIVFDLDVDLVHLVDEVRLLRREVANEAQVLDGFVPAVPRDQPTRRFFDEEGNTGEEESTRDELDGEGDEPLLARRRDVLSDTVVDPESDETTDLPSDFVHSDELTSNSGWRDFRDVERSQVRRCSNT
jgi:hypothetical protein